MAANQIERHETGREGERIARDIVGGCRTQHKAPFDIVDFRSGVAYEVKSMSGLSKDLKIHISEESMARKVKFANDYGLDMILVAVVIFSPDHIEVYKSKLQSCIRINQMELVEKRGG